MASEDVEDFVNEFMGHRKGVCRYNPALDWMDFVYEDVSCVLMPRAGQFELMNHPDEFRIVGFRIKDATRFVQRSFSGMEVRDGRIRVYSMLVLVLDHTILDDFHCLRLAATLARSSHVDAKLLQSVPLHYPDVLNLDLNSQPQPEPLSESV